MMASNDRVEWYAVTVLPRRERAVAASIAERHFPIFLPMQTEWRGSGRHMEPLMPSYVFVLCEPGDFAEIHGIEGVCGFVRYIRDDGIAWPIPLPSIAILGLQIEERAGTYDYTQQVRQPRYKPRKGEQVRITAGDYYGFVATVLATPQGDRCKLMIQHETFEAPRRRTEDVAHLTAA
jgi:transcription antitermination factor NusG